jgi:hypothetical protein
LADHPEFSSHAHLILAKSLDWSWVPNGSYHDIWFGWQITLVVCHSLSHLVHFAGALDFFQAE